MRVPRVVVAAPASGHGKTTVATGLMAALRRAGHVVSGHKIGPDYIDPGYHSLATGRPGRNLDPHLVGEDLVAPLFLHGAAGADIAVIEGVMGLYDGMIGTDGYASTAHTAALLSAPVILVVDVSHASRSIAAIVHGMASYDRGTRIAGVILNKAGSQRHSDEVIRALEPTGIPVIGVLGRDDGITVPSRHLGLVPAEERDEATAQVDRLARGSPSASTSPRSSVSPRQHPTCRQRRGHRHIHRGRTGDRCRRRSCLHLPLHRDRGTPARTRMPTGVVRSSARRTVACRHRGDLSRRRVPRGARHRPRREPPPAHAPARRDRGGSSDRRRVRRSALSGAGGRRARDGRRPRHLGTDDAAPDPRLPHRDRTAGHPARPRRHPRHRPRIPPPAITPRSSPAWLLDGRPDGVATATVHASYLHTHWAGHPDLARRFTDAARAAEPAPEPTSAPARRRTHEPDLHHHGDRDATEGWSTSPSTSRADRARYGSTTPCVPRWTSSPGIPTRAMHAPPSPIVTAAATTRSSRRRGVPRRSH